MAEKVALITGASRGIGRCAALALAKRGFDVAITARTVHEGDGRVGDVAIPGSLDKTAREVGELGREALSVPMDITDRKSIREGFQAVLERWQRVDVLVNNAPYSGPGGNDKVLEIDIDLAARVLEGNYLNQLYLSQLALPGMLERESGCIINMGSGSALVAPPAPAGEGGWGLAYCASKASFHQVATVIDVEFRSRGIRAFSMEPGFTVTERYYALGGDDRYSKGFRGDPPEVAGEVVGFLAAESAADRYLGRMVHAQALCAKFNLVPGWSPQAAQ